MTILNNDVTGVNQILPHKDKWAWDLYLKGCANHWMPTEISMSDDIKQWKDKNCLTEDERTVIKRCLGFFAGGESLVSNNLLLSIYKYVNSGEARQYIARQVFEETLHNLTIVYICDSLNLDIKEVYEAYHNIPSIKAKDDFLMSITKDIHSANFDINTNQGKQDFLKNLIIFYVICEGTLFFSGFATLLSFHRQGKMKGIGEQIQYTIKDENCHIEFGTKLINKIKTDHPEIWTASFQEEVINDIKRAVQLEIDYAKDILPRGILGLNSDMFIDYMKYIANIRLLSIGLSEQYENAKNPFEWLGEVIELNKMKNFFETRVTEYSKATMVDDL